jgi:hypothetical protein
MDSGRPKNQSSQNWMKPMPLCRARRADFGHILFLKNGHRMRKLSRYDRFPKQAKKSTNQSQQDVLMTSAVRQHDVMMTSVGTHGIIRR